MGRGKRLRQGKGRNLWTRGFYTLKSQVREKAGKKIGAYTDAAINRQGEASCRRWGKEISAVQVILKAGGKSNPRRMRAKGLPSSFPSEHHPRPGVSGRQTESVQCQPVPASHLLPQSKGLPYQRRYREFCSKILAAMPGALQSWGNTTKGARLSHISQPKRWFTCTIADEEQLHTISQVTGKEIAKCHLMTKLPK